MNKWREETAELTESHRYSIKPFHLKVAAFTVQTLKHLPSCFYSPAAIPETVPSGGSAPARGSFSLLCKKLQTKRRACTRPCECRPELQRDMTDCGSVAPPL